MNDGTYDFGRRGDFDKIVVLTDANVHPLFPEVLNSFPVIEIAPGEESKSVSELIRIWQRMGESGMTRNSLLVNVGGGVISDLGGFAAATFKRGIRHINVPTTLLAMADAAIGGKTGIDFLGLKNEIGAFHMPIDVIIDASWLSTLPRKEILEGLAEVVKTLLLDSNPTSFNLYNTLLSCRELPSRDELRNMAAMAANFKQNIVREDPFDKGKRRILNFGHTAGHAFESLARANGCPVGHGEAVAWGMLFAMILSEKYAGLDPQFTAKYKNKFLSTYYRELPEEARDADSIYHLMAHDKKNGRLGEVSMILLEAPGIPVSNISVGKTDIIDTLQKMLPVR